MRYNRSMNELGPTAENTEFDFELARYLRIPMSEFPEEVRSQIEYLGIAIAYDQQKITELVEKSVVEGQLDNKSREDLDFYADSAGHRIYDRIKLLEKFQPPIKSSGFVERLRSFGGKVVQFTQTKGIRPVHQ